MAALALCCTLLSGCRIEVFIRLLADGSVLETVAIVLSEKDPWMGSLWQCQGKDEMAMWECLHKQPNRLAYQHVLKSDLKAHGVQVWIPDENPLEKIANCQVEGVDVKDVLCFQRSYKTIDAFLAANRQGNGTSAAVSALAPGTNVDFWSYLDRASFGAPGLAVWLAGPGRRDRQEPFPGYSRVLRERIKLGMNVVFPGQGSFSTNGKILPTKDAGTTRVRWDVPMDHAALLLVSGRRRPAIFTGAAATLNAGLACVMLVGAALFRRRIFRP